MRAHPRPPAVGLQPGGRCPALHTTSRSPPTRMMSVWWGDGTRFHIINDTIWDTQAFTVICLVVSEKKLPQVAQLQLVFQTRRWKGERPLLHDIPSVDGTDIYAHSWNGHVQDGVFRMSLSPDGTLLAVIHFSGCLSVWDVPSLKQRTTWSQCQQVRLWRLVIWCSLCVCVFISHVSGHW